MRDNFGCIKKDGQFIGIDLALWLRFGISSSIPKAHVHQGFEKDILFYQHRRWIILFASIFSFGIQINIMHSQAVGIGTITPNPSAILDIKSNSNGFLLPRMTTAHRVAIANPLPGLQIYNLDDHCIDQFTGTQWTKTCGTNYDSIQVPPYTWIKKADFSGFARSSAVGFSIGDKGYVGTGYTGIFRKDFWEYDPTNNAWTQKADFGGSARSKAVGFSLGGNGYIGTGLDHTGYKNDFWQYDPTSNAWIPKSDFAGGNRYGLVGFAIGNYGYIGTGLDDTGYKNDFWQYDPVNNSWIQKADFGGGNRDGAIGFSIGNKGYIGTGVYTGEMQDFWEYDPVANSWNQKANFGGRERYNAVGFSLNNKGYIGLGRNFYEYKEDFWEYDVQNDSWSKKAFLQGLARENAIGFSIGNLAYMGLGYNNSYKSDFWSFSVDTTTQLAQSDALPLNTNKYTDYAWSSYDDTITTAVSPANVTIRGDLEVTGHIVNSLKFGSSSYDPMINLYNWPSNFSHFGFGVFEGSTLRYQIPTGSDKHRFYAGTDSIFTIFGNGNATLKGSLTANGILFTSDRRLKKNITPLTNSLSTILALNGYRYFWKDKSLGSTLQSGVLAQEVAQILPHLVHQGDDNKLAVDYIGIIPELIEALRALDQENQDLKAAYESRIQALERRMKSNK